MEGIRVDLAYVDRVNSLEHQPPLTTHDHDGETNTKGGWTAVKFILANETFEKLASMSLIANITVYLRTKYNMDGLLLVNVVNIWSGCSNFLTMPGALLSDAYLGRFYTLLIGSISAMLGMGAMTLGAAIPKLRPPSCTPPNDECIPPTSGQLSFLFMALSLLAIGAGCIRPCNIAFGADQFNTSTPNGRANLSRFYNWWYFSFTIALLIAFTAVVYVQTNISWTFGFAIPTSCFVISILIFLLGCPTYIYRKPQGSIFIDLVKVCVASFRKRKKKIGLFITSSYYDPPIIVGDGSFVCKLNRTDRFTCLDKAALICDPSEVDSNGIAINQWRLCSIQQVEQLKSIVGILPVWITGILCFVAMDQQNTFGILQAIQMSRKVGSRFLIPPAWCGLVSMVSLSLWILTYEHILLPVARKIKKRDNIRLSMTTRIKVGILISILCMSVAALVEYKRRNAALRVGSLESPISVTYLVPQLILSGLIEAFSAVAIMEFFTSQMPEHMRSIAGSIFFISLSFGNYLSTAIVNVVHGIKVGNGGRTWLGGQDLNKNRLDYFYSIIAATAFVNLVYFRLFASKYVNESNYNSNQNMEESSKRKDMTL